VKRLVTQAAGKKGVLSGSGATLPLITYQAWIQEYFTNVDPNVALSYTGTGSSTGISDIVNYNTDLGASDAALVVRTAHLDTSYQGGWSYTQ
jgi:ABC-type phosphate transport system substrate-binding protein